ncbi:MAG TPA: lipase secretion chaperone [Pseudomonas sp.]|nr:lipase secretion chaperone [Pseudomonas sp.]
MKKLYLAIALGLGAVVAGDLPQPPPWSPGADRESHAQPPNAAEARAWERRLRAYQRARARIQLNERLSPEERRQAIWQLQIDYFDAQDLARLWQHERQRDRQRQPVDL